MKVVATVWRENAFAQVLVHVVIADQDGELKPNKQLWIGVEQFNEATGREPTANG